ncbi:MAG: hypothetical protein K8M05_39030 [Deltaproteobacteria bacterium]|nr:hypothetical protein [Kofleriaceae bacterium]
MAESVFGLSGDALDLAVRASAAASVDAGLLRRLRLRFLKDSDASVEAAVWRSEAVESETGSGITFSTAALAELRRRFRASDVGATCDEIAAYHHGGPALLVLEEKLVRHALAREPAEIERALGEVLASLAQEGEKRGPTILHWANEALPRLPPVAQGTAAAWALSLAAQRQFDREILRGDPPPGLASFELSAYLPATDVPITVRTEDGYIVFGTGGDDGQRIEVPDTHPRIVVLDRGGTRTTVKVRAGEEVTVDNTTYPVVLGDLRGRRWRVRAVEEEAAGGPVVVRLLAIDVGGAMADPKEMERWITALVAATRRGSSSDHLDALLVLADSLDRSDADARADTMRLMGLWAGTRVISSDDTSEVVERAGCRVGVLGLGAPSGGGDDGPPLTVGGQLSVLLGGDVPELYREEVDAAVLIARVDPSERAAFGSGFGSGLAGAEDASLLELFDMRLVGPPHGEHRMSIGGTTHVPSLAAASTGKRCGLLAELVFEDGRLRETRQAWLTTSGPADAQRGAAEGPPRKRGQRAQIRRQIIRALRAKKSVLLVGAQATGKTALVAELIASPILKIMKTSSVGTILEVERGVDAVTTELDPGTDMQVLQEEHDPPLLLETSVLPFHQMPEMDPSWEVVVLGPLDSADVMDALAHVDARKREPIARWLIDETGGDPWLVWRAIAGARLRGANELASYGEPLAQAAAASVTDIDDLAAIELLAALRAGPSWPVDPRAKWQLEYYGVGQMKDGAFALSSPVVGKVVTDELLDRLRMDALGDLDDDPEYWVKIDATIPDDWVGPVATAIARAGFGVQEDVLGPVSRKVESFRSAEWVRIGGVYDTLLTIDQSVENPNREVVVRSSSRPDQVHPFVAEQLEWQASPRDRSLSQLLDELAVYDPAYVTVRSDIARKAARRSRIAEVPGHRRIQITDVESKRLVAAGARRGRKQRDPREQSISEEIAEDVELGRLDLGGEDGEEEEE